MGWTGGYNVEGGEEFAISTGIFVPDINARDGLYGCTVQVEAFQVWWSSAAPLPVGGGMTWSVQSRVRFRRRWTWNGSFMVPAGNEEIVVTGHITPVDVDNTLYQVKVNSLRWSVWRVT